MQKSKSRQKLKEAIPLARALNSPNQRQSIRFPPDAGAIALVDVSSKSNNRSFNPTITTLITEESHKGCGLVMKMTDDLPVGSICRVKVGNNPVLLAEVRWRIELDSQVIRVGIMFLE